MRILSVIPLCFCLFAATPFFAQSHQFWKKIRREVEESRVFARGFTGFVLLDAETGETLCDLNGDKYFTPASNLKILTLATCLEVLGDSVPRLAYVYNGSDTATAGSFYLSETGDPTFLHPDFKVWQPAPAFRRARPQASAIFLNKWNNQLTKRFGEGWMWDDFGESYSTELSGLPIYGNMVQVCWDGFNWRTKPDYFQKDLRVDPSAGKIYRDALGPTITVPRYPRSWYDTCFSLPVFRPEAINYHLLNDSLRIADPPANDLLHTLGPEAQFWYATPLDTVLRRMMFQSDNFLAEQMLLVCAGVKYDVLQQETMFWWARDSLFAGFPNPPRWVDGSGLSRYNLVTPRYLCDVLCLLWHDQPRERLLSLLPTPGASETTLDWWRPIPKKPWLYAKTGSMGGVQCLSGYLVQKSGRVLIFSFMHNNFIGSNRQYRLEMKRILEEIYAQ